ncbi:hypothetical protein ColLi_04241 [Colletotrichum liriopes]|uniref:Uncharacterized protein n=1 Tax=Colletotrichum liriopes TaxID=708192 RepID=A0AA37LRL8_9PEZI|nr:hypothetical protein ColLi_04241 [Colletotrichum liriopes]
MESPEMSDSRRRPGQTLPRRLELVKTESLDPVTPLSHPSHPSNPAFRTTKAPFPAAITKANRRRENKKGKAKRPASEQAGSSPKSFGGQKRPGSVPAAAKQVQNMARKRETTV